MYFLSISVIRNLLFYVKKKPCVLEPFLHLDCRMYSTDWQFLYLKSLMISNIFSHLTLFLRRTMTKFYNERKWVNIRKAVVFNFFSFLYLSVSALILSLCRSFSLFDQLFPVIYFFLLRKFFFLQWKDFESKSKENKFQEYPLKWPQSIPLDYAQKIS